MSSAMAEWVNNLIQLDLDAVNRVWGGNRVNLYPCKYNF